MKNVFVFLAGLTALSASAAELTIINNTGAPARIAELFNVCTGAVVPADKPIHLKPGESSVFTVPLVMNHYTICGSGFCSSTVINLRSGEKFTLSMELDGGVIDGRANPDQWDGQPTNPCPESSPN